MGILFTIMMGFLFTITIGKLFTIVVGIQLTISKWACELMGPVMGVGWDGLRPRSTHLAR